MTLLLGVDRVDDEARLKTSWVLRLVGKHVLELVLIESLLSLRLINHNEDLRFLTCYGK
jgi:hypothetical protein